MSNSKHYIWSAIGKFGTQALGFVGNILIARVLMPEDYGLIAMLAIIMGLAWNFTESGFADSLIRKQNSDKYDFGTVATFNLCASLLFYLIIYTTAPLISDFFKHEELIGIVRILALSLVLKSIVLPAITSLRKELKFNILAKMQLVSSIISISLTYLMALNGYGYWALAFQPIFIALANIFYLLVRERWRPYFCFKIDRFKEMYRFGINLMLSYITNQFGNNLYSVIIGKFHPVASLGFYRQAQKMQEVPTQGLNAVVLTTSYSIIAKEKDNTKQINLYRNIFFQFVTIQSVMTLVFIGIAKPMFVLLLGVKWTSSILFFQLFMLIALIYPLVTINSNIAKIHNNSKIYRNLTFFRNGLKLVALIIFAKSSLVNILYGQIAAAYISVVIDMYFCGRIIDFTIKKQLITFFKIFYKPFIAYTIAMISTNLVEINLYISGVLWLSVFSISLLFIYVLTRDELFFQIFQNVKSQILKYKNA
ncbi:lipopolysaccharide biosynthesis protein [Marinifilum sp. D737]|uniref:lipopolysaccharide biosynthesis protein n=1 Tax=Marinifilum sp. D737 TaxID=2969628 RepID=UPI002276FA70|nr:lipopolysaccharide biosynthesis protein [Marinifilum sp. D737]MCY1635006.1 lipopolysaccharide biosynthesis protein [Marinifilum sp. D737]